MDSIKSDKQPLFKTPPRYNYRLELGANGQDGDVYRYILFMVGVVNRFGINSVALAIEAGFVAYDAKPAFHDGRVESRAELADDITGKRVGKQLGYSTMQNETTAKKEIADILCAEKTVRW